ncbi:polyketide synthase Pks13 [Corynebacterium guangdongense]|uniref:Polyketide synthase 13 n=1 Tax=Corynebacterium guangdongense TaxID=1783348 RepID=A0ABU1ZZV0_9CORY|nr:polyketide synthase Pks13 [Corynebacterium guangdongense]MDR7330450.1 polyketide synthase 13 [Corynebacterium guangdongense]WJZ19008.1 Phthiocerol/phenolphthiocerol synthesis polyketide synthase type I PpsA [Corynebacterium guangdongense]
MSSMTEQELVAWLKNWVADITGVDPSEVTETTPLERYGLSSRDAVVMSGELENLLGTQLDATIAYEYPTIAQLAKRLIEGEPRREQAARTARRAPLRADKPGVHDIAIVGVSARFPGAEDKDAYWDLLAEGRSATSERPLGRWSEYSGDEVVVEKMASVSTAGGYLEDIAAFDNEFFGLSPVEATNMDPQQRILLELTWHALENAHIPANELRGESVGVFVGSSNNDYGMMITADPAEAHPYALTGTASSIVPNRISYAFDFRGPSVNVDTACSSSLVATHYAVRALRDGEADVAIAGGVNILASPFVSTAFGELGVISPTGAIHAFSDDADGFVRAEGAGVLVLKRVEDAMADGDEILAVIKGSAVNSDGHSNGLTAPNPEAQVDVLERAYADAGVDPREVDYVEAHGTGTILGDPIEATALGAVLGEGRTAANPTLLGSVKSNIGHSESAAGAAALIKVVGAIRNDTIPASINFSEPNRYIDFDAEHLEVVEDPREWPEYSGRKIAGVSGFGFGGTNAHVVVSDFDPADYLDLDAEVAQSASEPAPSQLIDPEDPNGVVLPVSGLLASRRRQAAAVLADFLEGRADEDLVPVARSLAGRNHGRARAAVTANTVADAVTRLRKIAEGKTSLGSVAADSPATLGPVFVYSGFGSQHRKMAKKLLEISPLFAARLEELDAFVDFESGWSMLELIRDDEQTYNTETAQVTITAIQIAVTDLLAAFGATPAGVIGMSMGEIAAAYAAGGISAQDAMLIACHRARLMGEGEEMLAGTENEGAMAVVELTREQLAEFNSEHTELPDVEPAVYAGPGMTTVGGNYRAVDALVAQLEEEGKFARKLQVKGSGHTSALDPIMGELEGEIAGVEARPITVPLYSSVDRGEVYQPGAVVHDDRYFLRMTRQPVWLQDATEQALAAGHETLVEIAPNPVAIMGMMNTAFSVGKSDVQLLFALKRKVEETESLRDLLAKLYVQGAPIDFGVAYGDGPRLSAPLTEFKRHRYWTNARPSSTRAASGLPGTRVTLPDGRVAFATDADQAPSAIALMETAAAAVNPAAELVATEDRATLPASGEVTTIVDPGLGGLRITVHAVAENGTGTLVAEGFASTLGATGTAGAALPGVADAATVEAATAAVTEQYDALRISTDEVSVEAVRWDPASGETVEARLRAIVSESMGYDVDDLPAELPLIDLGLDSLMGMRIKNRVENDFQIPPLQVQALRDASVADVVAMVEEAVASRGHEPAPAPAVTPEPQEVAGHPEAGLTAADVPSGPAPAGVGVAPRDASERMVFGTWAKATGKAAAGVKSELPPLTDEQAAEIAERLSERSGIEVTADAVRQAQTLEPLADLVREGLETAVEGNVRVLRPRTEGSDKPAVFMFHPAGGSSVVYEPLSRRLDSDVPVYGVERLEGSLEDRAAAYVADIVRYSEGRPVVLGGWSFGGALAYEVAHQLRDTDVAVDFIALLDTTQPSEPAPDTMEETKARWQRYADFAARTYGLEFEVPVELLETAGEEAMLGMLEHYLASTDASAHGLSAGVLEHQRASFVDNQILARIDFRRWAEVDVPVLLFRSERMHDGAIELEPAYAHIDEDGGWGKIVKDLEIVQLPGDHLAVPDEPVIGIVGAHMMKRIK